MDWERIKQKGIGIGLNVGISAANKAKRMQGLSEDERQEWGNVEREWRKKREIYERGTSPYYGDEEYDLWNDDEYDDENYGEDWDEDENFNHGTYDRKRESDEIYSNYNDEEDDEWDELEEQFNLPYRNSSGTIKKSKSNVESNSNSYLARTKSKPEKPHCNIGTIGHIGHGKTTLTSAITKVLRERYGFGRAVAYEKINKVPEKREYGIAISAACVQYETPNRQYTHVDCPEHANYVKNMIIGAAPMDDAAILVVNVAEGVMAQTREHILLARQLGIPYIVAFMNMCDLVDDPELLELVELEIRELLNEYKFPGDDIPIIQGSAIKALEDPFGYWGDMILELMDAVDCYVPDPIRDSDKPFLMPIEDVFPITGRGMVAVGRIERGTLHVGDKVEIVGVSEESRKVFVTGIEMFRRLFDEACPGDNIGALLRGVQESEIEKGQCLCTPGTVKCCNKFVAQIYVLDESECGYHVEVLNKHHAQFCFRTEEVAGTCYLPKNVEMCISGDNIEMLIELIHPVPMERGLFFVVCEDGKAIGGGKVISMYQMKKSY